MKSRGFTPLLLLPFLSVSFAACGSHTEHTGTFPGLNANGVSDEQRITIEQLTSIFENGTPAFQYSYIEDIGDGAGVTCGRIGFTGPELKAVVTEYSAAKKKEAADAGVTTPDLPLTHWLPCLEKQGEHIEQDYRCLYPDFHGDMNSWAFKREGGLIAQFGFGKDWVEAGHDPVMRQVQDANMDHNYYTPALNAAVKAHVHTPLALALIYDTNIQMGNPNKEIAYAQKKFSTDHDGRTDPETDDEELEWLGHYQDERIALLGATPVGKETIPRVDSLNQIVKARNVALQTPFTITYFGEKFTLTGKTVETTTDHSTRTAGREKTWK